MLKLKHRTTEQVVEQDTVEGVKGFLRDIADPDDWHPADEATEQALRRNLSAERRVLEMGHDAEYRARKASTAGANKLAGGGEAPTQPGGNDQTAESAGSMPPAQQPSGEQQV